MSRRRYLSTKISTDAGVNRLAAHAGDFAALLYTWMVLHAEDDCSLPNDAGEILMAVIPGRRDKTEEDVEAALEAMADLGLIWRFPEQGLMRFPPESFYKYQTYVPANKRWSGCAPTLAKNSDDQRETPKTSEDQRFPSPSLSPSLKEKREGDIAPVGADDYAEFGEAPSLKSGQAPIPADAKRLAARAYDHQKAIDGLPPDKSRYFWQQARYAQDHLLPARPCTDWLAAWDWGETRDYWRPQLTRLSILARLWPEYAAARDKQARASPAAANPPAVRVDPGFHALIDGH